MRPFYGKRSKASRRATLHHERTTDNDEAGVYPVYEFDIRTGKRNA